MQSDVLSESSFSNAPASRYRFSHRFYYDKDKIKLTYPLSPIKKRNPVLTKQQMEYTALPFQTQITSANNITMTNLAHQTADNNTFIVAPDGLMPNSRMRAQFPKYKKFENKKLEIENKFENNRALIECILNTHLSNTETKPTVRQPKISTTQKFELDIEYEKKVEASLFNQFTVVNKKLYLNVENKSKLPHEIKRSRFKFTKVKEEKIRQTMMHEIKLPPKRRNLFRTKLYKLPSSESKEEIDTMNATEKTIDSSSSTDLTDSQQLNKDQSIKMTDEEFEKWSNVLLNTYKTKKKLSEQIKTVLFDDKIVQNELHDIFKSRTSQIGYVNKITDSAHFIEYMLQFYDDNLSVLLDDIDDVMFNGCDDIKGKLLKHCGADHILQTFITDYKKVREIALLEMEKSFPNYLTRFKIFDECLRKGPKKAVIKIGFRNNKLFAIKFFKAILRCDRREINQIIADMKQNDSLIDKFKVKEQQSQSTISDEQVSILPSHSKKDEKSSKLLKATSLDQMTTSINADLDTTTESIKQKEEKEIYQYILKKEGKKYHSEVIEYLKLFLAKNTETAKELLVGILDEHELAKETLVNLMGPKQFMKLMKSLKLFEIKIKQEILGKSQVNIIEIDEIKAHLETIRVWLQQMNNEYKYRSEKDAEYYIRNIPENDKKQVAAFQKKFLEYCNELDELLNYKLKLVNTVSIIKKKLIVFKGKDKFKSEKLEKQMVQLEDENTLMKYRSLSVNDEQNAQDFTKPVPTRHSVVKTRSLRSKSLSLKNIPEKPKKARLKFNLNVINKPKTLVNQIPKPMSTSSEFNKLSLESRSQLSLTRSQATPASQVSANRMMTNQFTNIYGHLVNLMHDDADFDIIDNDFNSLVSDIYKESQSSSDTHLEKQLEDTVKLLNENKREETNLIKKDPKKYNTSIQKDAKEKSSKDPEIVADQIPERIIDYEERKLQRKVYLHNNIVDYWRVKVFKDFIKTMQRDKSERILEKLRKKEENISSLLAQILKETINEQKLPLRSKKPEKYRETYQEEQKNTQTHPFYTNTESFIDSFVDSLRGDNGKIDFNRNNEIYGNILDAISEESNEEIKILVRHGKDQINDTKLKDNQDQNLTVIPKSSLDHNVSPDTIPNLSEIEMTLKIKKVENYVTSPAISIPAVSSPAILSPVVLSQVVASQVVASSAVVLPTISSPAISAPAVAPPAVAPPAVATPVVAPPVVAPPPVPSQPVLSPRVSSKCEGSSNISSQAPSEQIQEMHDLLYHQNQQKSVKQIDTKHQPKLSRLTQKPTNPLKDFQNIYGPANYYLPYITPNHAKSEYQSKKSKGKLQFIPYNAEAGSALSSVHKNIYNTANRPDRPELRSLLRNANFVQRPSDICLKEWNQLGAIGMARNMVVQSPNHTKNFNKVFNELAKYGVSCSKLAERHRLVNYIGQAQTFSRVSNLGQCNN